MTKTIHVALSLFLLFAGVALGMLLNSNITGLDTYFGDEELGKEKRVFIVTSPDYPAPINLPPGARTFVVKDQPGGNQPVDPTLECERLKGKAMEALLALMEKAAHDNNCLEKYRQIKNSICR